MYICTECMEVFENLSWWTEPHGEEMCGCPYCGGTAQEAKKCEICNEYYLEEELHGGVCDKCIGEYRKDFNACYKVSLGETTEIEINSLLASLFDAGDIEQILKEYIRNRWQDVSCDKFIDEDKSWFGERLAEEVKKNENTKG